MGVWFYPLMGFQSTLWGSRRRFLVVYLSSGQRPTSMFPLLNGSKEILWGQGKDFGVIKREFEFRVISCDPLYLTQRPPSTPSLSATHMHTCSRELSVFYAFCCFKRIFWLHILNFCILPALFILSVLDIKAHFTTVNKAAVKKKASVDVFPVPLEMHKNLYIPIKIKNNKIS